MLKERPNGRFIEGEVQFIVAELLKGLETMYLNDIVHFDLKPDNILINFPDITLDPRKYEDWFDQGA